MANTVKVVEIDQVKLPIDDAILILKEEHKQRVDGYATHISYGGKGDPSEEVSLDALEMAISALEHTKWIPVTERLPEKHDRYLVLTPSPFGHKAYTPWLAWYEPEVGFFDSDPEYGDLEMDDVTHWMPLPEPPKGE